MAAEKNLTMKNRWIKIALLSLLLFGFCGYARYFHPWISLSDCIKHPERYDRHVVLSFDEPVIGKIDSTGFELLYKGGPPIYVYADTSGLKSGEFVALSAVFHKEGYLVALRAAVAYRRREKMAVSVIPVIFVGILFFRYFRIRHFQIERKERSQNQG